MIGDNLFESFDKEYNHVENIWDRNKGMAFLYEDEYYYYLHYTNKESLGDFCGGHIHVFDQSQFVYIDIEDTGKGIPKSKFKTVFKPGYTTKKRGWGLGLSLTKRIIENYHGGKIFVKGSEMEKGTTFRIVLNK